MTVFRSSVGLRQIALHAFASLFLIALSGRSADAQTAGSSTAANSASVRPSDLATDPRLQMDSSGMSGLQRQLGGQLGGQFNFGSVTGDRSISPLEPTQRRPEFPPKPSEFQKFVQAATGRLLPVFGSSFFTPSSDGTSAPDNVPVSADYTIGPGDEIVVRVWGSIDADYRSTVDRNGQLNLPRIGSFTVAGVRAADLEKQLRAQIGRLYTNFNLNVTVGQLHGVRVFVVGPALLPGVFTLSGQATLLSAVVAAGGPGPNGSMRKVTLRRDGRAVSELDVYAFLVQGDKSKDIQLVAGDVIVFHPVGPRVALNGELDNAAIYELKEREEPLGEVLRYAGGTPVLTNPNRAVLERIDPSQPRTARFVEEIKLNSAGLSTPVRDGDVVTLLAISPGFANAVTLRGHVAEPLRYPYFPGMRISDLIPNAEALISPDFFRRKNMLVQQAQDDTRIDRSDDGSSETLNTVGDRDRQRGQTTGSATSSTSVNAGSQNPSGSTATGQNTTTSPSSSAATPAVPSTTSNTQQTTRQSGDNTQNTSTGDRVRKAPTTLFDDVNWDYAAIERLNLKDLSTQVIPFNLGKVVLQRDPANNIELMPGDVVNIFSQKDFRVPVSRQNRLVWLEGEVVTPGVYQLLPGETLRQLIERAGGFTPQAYVFGTDFSREETRQRQRENLAAAIARLESLSATQTARDAANRTDIGAAGSAALSAAASRAQLARLAKVEPNGRIALELSPDANSIDSLPDIPLENADRIVVPPRPAFVTVVGAVVNNNAFLWRPGRTAGDYLQIAGPDEAADTSNMFILRADGTVNGSASNRGFFGRSNIDALALNPGDALIVPNQLDFETWGRAFVRNAKDWTQILANLGLGVAAINSITK